MSQGGCLCGTVRFEATEFYAGVFKCHCSKCRRAFGGASSAAALCGEDNFHWLQGEASIRRYTMDSGFTRVFCDSCGGILPQHLPDYRAYWVPAGLLDDDAGLELRRHIHVDSKATWEILDAQTPTLPEGFE